MPIYEYKCSECGNHLEKMQKISDAPLTVCEVCGGKLEKQWSLSGIQFKGAGWYVTDYSNKLKEPGAAKSEQPGTSGKSEAADQSDKTENKTEKSEKTEKTSAAESTAKTESASKPTSDTANSKKETTAAKD